MSETAPKISHWKLMLIGSSATVSKRLFVVGLSAVSLVVWTVTVIGTGLFHGGRGPAMAEAGTVLLVSPSVLLAEARKLEGVPADESAAVAAVAVEPLSRDPFAANEAYFPKAKVAALSGAGQGTLKEGATAEAAAAENLAAVVGQPALLKIEALLLGDREQVAIVRGNAVRLEGGQTMVLVVKASHPGQNDDAAALPAEASRRLRVGDELEVRPATLNEGCYRMGEQSTTLQVKDVSQRGVVFTLGGKAYVLEMQK